jgi:hypothetical protein
MLRNCTKFLIFSLRKTYTKKRSCTKSANFFVEYSIGYAIGKGEVVMRSSNRCTDLAYIHFFLKAEILSQRINI